MDLRRSFTEHPASIGETYGEHLVNATRFAVSMIAAGVACLIHAFLPFLFVQTASRVITDLHERMIGARRMHPRTPAIRGSPPVS